MNAISRILMLGALTVWPLGAFAHLPTPLPVPDGAVKVERGIVTPGRSFQTQFELTADYPATPALSFYQASLASPWVHCDWAPEWSTFIDAQKGPIHAVHQQLHMWIDPVGQRTLMLSMRYLSDPTYADAPDNDVQHVVLVESFDQRVDETIKWLGLRCPVEREGR